MRAFSIAWNGYRPGEGGRDGGETFLHPGGQSEAELLWEVGIVADEESFVSAPFVSGNSPTWSDPSMSSTPGTFPSPSQWVGVRAERSVEPTAASAASTARGKPPRQRTWCGSENEFRAEKDPGRHADMAHGGMCGRGGEAEGVTDPSEISVQVSARGEMEEAEDNDIGAADWLDVTHALLDAAQEYEKCNR